MLGIFQCAIIGEKIKQSINIVRIEWINIRNNRSHSSFKIGHFNRLMGTHPYLRFLSSIVMFYMVSESLHF